MQIDLLTLITTVEIDPLDEKLDVRTFTTAAGKSVTVRNQPAYFYKPSRRHPEYIQLSIPENTPPYKAGRYFIHPDSFNRGDYDTLELSRYDLKLIPVPVELLKPIKAG